MYLRIRSQRGRPRLNLLCGAIACAAIWGVGSGLAQAQCSGGSSSGGGGGGGGMMMGGGGGGRMGGGGGGGTGGSTSSSSSAASALMMVQMANQAQAQRQQYLRNQAALIQSQMPIRHLSPRQEKLAARIQQRATAKQERIAKRKEAVKNGSRPETLVASRR